jgi:hypothetical protein
MTETATRMMTSVLSFISRVGARYDAGSYDLFLKV